MKTFKLLVIGFCFMLVFIACNNKPHQIPEKEISTSDTTPQASRDSIARGTTVTPSASDMEAD